MNIKRFFFTLSFMAMSSWLIAEDDSYCGDASPSGISVDIESKTLVSVFRAFVFVDDRMGIRNAVIIAEEGAKNQMIRWFSQELYTEREIVDSITISGTTTQLTDSSGKQTTNSVTREMVNEVINEIEVGKKTSIKEYANDLWINTQVKSLAARTVGLRVFSYNFETIKGRVYIAGITSRKKQLETLIQAIKTVKGVKEIVNYVVVKE